MRKLIYLGIALVIGLLDGLLGATFGLSGLGFSLMITAVVGLFVSGLYPASVFVVVFASIIKHLLSGVAIGWLGLFASIAIGLAGSVRYFIGANDRWIGWASGAVLLVALYFFEFLVSRGFDLTTVNLLKEVSIGGVLFWVVSNLAFVVLFSWIFTKLGAWIENEE